MIEDNNNNYLKCGIKVDFNLPSGSFFSWISTNTCSASPSQRNRVATRSTIQVYFKQFYIHTCISNSELFKTFEYPGSQTWGPPRENGRLEEESIKILRKKKNWKLAEHFQILIKNLKGFYNFSHNCYFLSNKSSSEEVRTSFF